MSGTLKRRRGLLMQPESVIRELAIQHNEQQDDIDELNTLATELRDDHASFRTTVLELETLSEELGADHATFKTVCDDLKTLLNNLRTVALNHVVSGLAPTFAIDTNFDVKNTEVCNYLANGTYVVLADNTNCNTGTSKTIAADQWAGMLITGSAAGALTGTWSADAASEAAAITAVKALSASNQCPLGYVTVQTASGQAWIAGTDALTTGTGGNVAAATNYYNYDNVVAVTAAVSSSAPATLSASTSITAPPATITAAAVTVGSCKIGDDSGTAYSA